MWRQLHQTEYSYLRASADNIIPFYLVLINKTLGRVHSTIVAIEEANITIYSECVIVAFAIQHTMSLRHITFSSVACPDLTYFPTLSHTRHYFRKIVFLH